MIDPSHRPPDARGYTLLEMIIVLAIVASLSAMVVPALRGPLAKSRLRDAAKQVRLELARARLDAIESGVAQTFRFQPGTRRFEVAPKQTAPFMSSRPSFDIGVSGSGIEFGSSTTSATPSSPVALSEESTEQALPDGVFFYGQQAAQSPADGLDDDLTFDSGGANWSTPIVFYPNGRTSNTVIRLVGERSFFVDVTMRGLTGSVTIAPLRRAEASE